MFNLFFIIVKVENTYIKTKVNLEMVSHKFIYFSLFLFIFGCGQHVIWSKDISFEDILTTVYNLVLNDCVVNGYALSLNLS